VLLAHAAARTERVRLTTGVITLPLEDPVRVAEDAAVLDALSGGRLEIGLASGGSPSSFALFGLDPADKHALFATKLDRLEGALAGEDLGGGSRLYPPAPGLRERMWLATFSEPLAIEAGRRGHGLMLSRTQPRPADEPDLGLGALQTRLIDAYLAHLPSGVPPRVSVARTLVVGDDGDRVRGFADVGLRRSAPPWAAAALDGPLDELLAATDSHAGTPEQVRGPLAADPAIAAATHLSFQAHSVDPPHDDVLRSIELIASQVAPALGWSPAHDLAPVLS
jgi:putative FMN-dependent luciferase-like monooxygenase